MKHSKQQDIPFLWALFPLLVMIVTMAVTIIRFEGTPHIPLIVGTITAGLVAHFHGHSWKNMEEGMYQGIRLALPAMLIIILVGLIIATWIGGGIIASLIYYGLKIMTPSLFLVSICLICCVVSLAIGSSWSTMGTIGVAGMGIGISMGIPAPFVAGAIISGAYFGDKMSPLSDTTNLASGVTETDLFEHIRHMFYTTIPGLVIALSFYFFAGMQFSAHNIQDGNIQTMISTLEKHFVISPWLLLVPMLVIFLVAKKVPALPALAVGVLSGFICQVFVQGDPAGDAIRAMYDGYTIESGQAWVDELFNRGGIESMMYTVSLTIVAMTFGGIMESTGMQKALVNQILKFAKSAKSLIPTTILSSFVTNVTAAEQYISILLPSRMFASAYKKRNLHSKNLSRALEDGGTVTSALVPWNTCGVFITSTLGVNTFQYAPYAIFNYTVPVIGILLAVLGVKVAGLNRKEE
jgi:Na+:H+ antiporter, NhaC family